MLGTSGGIVSGFGLNDRLGQRRHGDFADRCGTHRGAHRAGAAEKVASGNGLFEFLNECQSVAGAAAIRPPQLRGGGRGHRRLGR